MLGGDPLLLSHGWVQGKGFLKYKWEAYSELPLLYLLAIGSSTHPISPESWYAWQRPVYSYGPYHFISGGPLFTHQYSQAWVDFRWRREDRGEHTDWFPAFRGELRSDAEGPLSSRLLLIGDYEIPLGTIGTIVNRSLLGNAAERSLRAFGERFRADVLDEIRRSELDIRRHEQHT